MKVLKFIAILLFLGIFCFDAYQADSPKETLEKVGAGVTAGQNIVALLNFTSTSTILTRISKIASNIGPFLGALGPIISLITLFFPQGESEELKYMKKQFAVVDANFDKVFNRFTEIKNLIQETSMKNQYSPYEANIMALSRRLRHFLNAPTDSVNEFKATFIESYRSSFQNSAFIIWRGMVGQGVTFQFDIPSQAMKYTNNHRRKVQEVMNGGLNLIMQGVKVHLTYLKAIGRDSSYETEKKEWEVKIKAVLNRMKVIDKSVESKWLDQAKSDCIDQMAEFKDKSNAALADKLYALLKDKFGWIEWMVVVYDDLHGTDKHWVQFCNGFYKFRHHGKNLVVASTRKFFYYLRKSCAKRELLKTRTKPKTSYDWELSKLSGKIDAKYVFEMYFPPEYKDCTSPGGGVILKTGNPEFRGPSDRFVVVDNNWYKLYVFR